MHASNSFRPLLTPLEDRTNPAGNVVARVVDGTLFVDGDAGANEFHIAGTGGQSVAVRALNADTTVNDRADGGAIFIGGITSGIVIRGGDGEDTIVLDGVRNGRYIGVFAEGGEDLVILNAVTSRGAVEISTGAGDDQVKVSHSNFRKGAAADLGEGNDTLEVTNSKVRERARFNGGEGTNTLAADGGQFARSIQYRNFQSTFNGPLPPPTVSPTNPTVVVSSSAGESTAAETIPFTVTFSERVSGFTIDDLGVTNGLTSDFATADNVSFTFNVTPSADGAVTVVVPPGAGNSRDGLANLSSDPFTVLSLRTDAGMTDVMPAPSDPSWVPTGSGLSTWDISPGSGSPVTAETSRVQVFYTGWLAADGTEFDSARTTGQPASFDPAGLIAGFREGLIGMQPGSIRRFLIPPELGYGSGGSGNIPANATLIFEVKLVSVS